MKSTSIVCLFLALFSSSGFGQSALLNRAQLGPTLISDEYLEWDDRYDAIALFADSLCKRLDRMWVTGLINEEQRDKERGLLLDLFHGESRNQYLTILSGNEEVLKEAPLRRRLIIRRRNILRQIDQLETQALLSYGATHHLETGLKEDEVWNSNHLFSWIPFESVEMKAEYPEDFEEATNEFISSIMPLLPELRVEELAINIDTIETAWRRGLGYTLTAVINGMEIGVQELFPYGFHRDSTPPRYRSLAQFTLPGVSLLNTWLKESSSPNRLGSIQAMNNNRPTGSWLIVLVDERKADLLPNYSLPGVLKVVIPSFSTYGLRKDRELAFREIKRSGLLDRLGDDEFAQLERQMTLFCVEKESDYFAMVSVYLLQPCEWNFHPEQISGSELAAFLEEVTLGLLQVQDPKVTFDSRSESGIIEVVTASGSHHYEGSLYEFQCGEEFGEFLRRMIEAEPVDLVPVPLGPRRPQVFVTQKQWTKLGQRFPETFGAR